MREMIYIAGPYTKPDPDENTRKAMEVWHQLADLGFVPFLPHLSHFLEQHRTRPYAYWLEYDNQFIPFCKGLLRMPGESSGSDKEVMLAEVLGIPVFHSIEELDEYFAASRELVNPTPEA